MNELYQFLLLVRFKATARRFGLLLQTEYSYWSGCRSVTIISFAKKTAEAESIEMSFGMWTRVGQSNHVLDGGANSNA